MELTSLPELFSEKFNGRGMKLLRGVPFLIFDVLFDLVVAVFLFFFLLFFFVVFLFFLFFVVFFFLFVRVSDV